MDFDNKKRRESSCRFCVCCRFLLQAKFLEQQHPDQVDPAEYDTGGDRNQNTDDQTKNAAALCEGRPSDYDFGEPVDDRDQEQEDLHQTALFVKPSHDNFSFSFILCILYHQMTVKSTV